jgi:cytochrome c
MSRWRRSVLGALTVALLAGGVAEAQGRFPGVGRPATPAEIRAWDIDVRPDFTGLPKGSGSVAKGQEVWDEKCAACHGTFGESTQVFPPIVGGTTKADMATGRVAGLQNPSEQRTTLMKLATLSTLWDYINRAMPWNAPKSLTTEEVYALVAYILHLGDIVPADFVLSDGNIREVQDRLPNRHGLTQRHGLWSVKGAPDVRSSACMGDCPTAGAVTSTIPGHARNAHGNLFEQNRLVGPVRGTDTTKPPLTGAAGEAARALTRLPAAPASLPGGDGLALARKHACVACHAVDQRTVGPSFAQIAEKYRPTAEATSVLVAKMKSGGVGAWGSVPMPPQAHVSESDLRAIAQWILAELK